MTSFRSISAAAALTALVIVPTPGFAKLTAPAAQTTPSAVPAGFTAASHGAPTTPEIKVAPTGPQWFPGFGSLTPQQPEIKVAPTGPMWSRSSG